MTTRTPHAARAIAARAIGTDDGSAAYAAHAVRSLRGPSTLAALEWANEYARRVTVEGSY
jgi:hypothetical protein